MKGTKVYIIIIAVLMGLFIITEMIKPKRTDWSPTLQSDDLIPYGTYLFTETLKDIFPGSKIHVVDSSFYQVITTNKKLKGTYIFICNEFELDKSSYQKMIEWIKKGNNVLVATSDLKILADSLHLSYRTMYEFFSKKDSLFQNDNYIMTLTSQNFKEKSWHHPRAKIISEITIDTNSDFTVLGLLNNNAANFIKYKIGAGNLFIHSTPLIFSNYYIADSRFNDYPYIVLSNLPKTDIYYDQNLIKPNNYNTPLYYMLSKKEYQWAVYITVLGIFLFLIFHSKRKQRPIKVVKPPVNTTLEFNETIADLYYGFGEHKLAASKKIKYFSAFLRNKYQVNYSSQDKDSVEYLSLKAGIDKEYLEKLLNYIIIIDNQKSLSKAQLIDLNSKIDEFYKKVKYVEY